MSLKRSIEDKDYMKMSYEQRAFDTDRLEAPPGHVITGVRMRNIGGHINLEAQVSETHTITVETQTVTIIKLSGHSHPIHRWHVG